MKHLPLFEILSKDWFLFEKLGFKLPFVLLFSVSTCWSKDRLVFAVLLFEEGVARAFFFVALSSSETLATPCSLWRTLPSRCDDGEWHTTRAGECIRKVFVGTSPLVLKSSPTSVERISWTIGLNLLPGVVLCCWPLLLDVWTISSSEMESSDKVSGFVTVNDDLVGVVLSKN